MDISCLHILLGFVLSVYEILCSPFLAWWIYVCIWGLHLGKENIYITRNPLISDSIFYKKLRFCVYVHTIRNILGLGLMVSGHDNEKEESFLFSYSVKWMKMKNTPAHEMDRYINLWERKMCLYHWDTDDKYSKHFLFKTFLTDLSPKKVLWSSRTTN